MPNQSQVQSPDADQVEQANKQTFKKLREQVQELQAAVDLEKMVNDGQTTVSNKSLGG